MDTYLFHLINNLADADSILGRVGIYTTRYLIYVLAIMAIIFCLFIFKKGKDKFLNALKIFLAISFTYIINFLIGVIYFRPRPFAALDSVHELIKKSPLDKSFPSDHAGIAFAIAFAVFLTCAPKSPEGRFWCVNKKWGSLFLIIALLIGISRVFVGVHYPLDILAGIFTGFLGAILGRYIIQIVAKNK